MEERYYTLVEGTLGCRVPHDTLAQAFAEAKRLSELPNVMTPVRVLQVIGSIEQDARTQRKKQIRYMKQMTLLNKELRKELLGQDE